MSKELTAKYYTKFLPECKKIGRNIIVKGESEKFYKMRGKMAYREESTFTLSRVPHLNMKYCAKKQKLYFLTGAESLALMGFPDIKCLSENQKYKVAGNSIVVPVLEHIFKGIKKEKENE